MTREKIKNTPEIVDYLLDKSVIKESREKLHKRLDEVCNLAIKALEQESKTRWISVSEELPKKNEWYSCTVDLSNFQLVTMDLYFKNGKWLDNRRIDMFNCYEIYGYGFGKSIERHKLDYSELLEDFDWTERVVAWMPLPEPFDPQESER